ncbi:hypothetical protein M5X11_28110 [Paenibacillus alginolyticus]|uniref:hypothetical protein n=1 Tax=Paenibacillus alginolyticus TaxID=59839 RepID=UPI00040551B5|nr:hypothetical protein [Paenibacillus alginolyticus]MCY9668743.1 hypothetical protein [Paenibacillus alginolyticus]
MFSLELIHKEKNGFGDMYYYIRDENGVMSRVYEGDLEEFLKKKGVPLLKEGVPFIYPQKSKR